ncbi:hypothetical protein SCARD494_05100 [Seiridium cardinale]
MIHWQSIGLSGVLRAYQQCYLRERDFEVGCVVWEPTSASYAPLILKCLSTPWPLPVIRDYPRSKTYGGVLRRIGVFQTTYQETYLRDYSVSSLSWIFALQLALMQAADHSSFSIANVDLIVNANTTTPTRAISKSPSSSHATKPISELYVDRLLALARSTDMLKYNKPYTVKKNGLFVGNYSLTFFSDGRLQHLSAQLRNDKVKDLVRRISSVISSRVGHYDNVSSSTIKYAADTRPVTAVDPNAAAFWIKCKSYFEQVHPFYPFLDRGSFESLAYGSELSLLLAQNKPWSALYHTVLALGCQVTGGGSFEPGKGEAWRLFSTSLAIFPDLMTLPDSLVLLQAMAAMTIYSVGISCLAVEHVILSEAARRAQSLGSTNLSGNASISYQRVFWVLYSVEKVSSFHLGRNSVFFDHDIVSPVPNLPEAVFEGFDWFLTSVRYSRLLSRAMTSLFSAGVLGNPEDYYLAAIDQLTEELDKWRLSIPAHLRPGDNPGRRIAHLSSLIRVPTIWMSCLYNSFRLSLCRATLHLAAGAREVVSPARQAAATRTMMETSRSTLELATFIDVEPYTPLWVLGGIPLTSHFILFDFVINNPRSPETATNLALLDIAGGHFSRIEYASGGCLPGSLIGEFAHIARDFVNSADCNGGNPPRRPPSPLASVVGRSTASSPPTSSPITGSDNDIYTATITNNPVSAIEAIPGLTINPFITNNDLPLLDTLYFPINNDFLGLDGSSGMGTDIMNLFNTYIPGIDPVFLNQPIDGSFVQRPEG